MIVTTLILLLPRNLPVPTQERAFRIPRTIIEHKRTRRTREDAVDLGA